MYNIFPEFQSEIREISKVINENPRHKYCSLGADSWCEWKNSEAIGANPGLLEQPALLHPDVQKHILLIYGDLSKDDSLKKCFGG